MDVHWAYYGCGKEDEEQLQRAWDEKQRRLRSGLNAFSEEPAELQMAVYRQEESPRWQIQAALHLADRPLVARSARPRSEEALDEVVSTLLGKLDRLASDPPNIAAKDRDEELEGMSPLLERWRREGRSDIFMAWLAPAIASLGAHVRRELRLRARESGMATGLVTPAEVLNEVLVEAYEQFDRRPAHMPLRLWLLRLADKVLEESIRPLAEESLEERVERPSSEPRDSERSQWVEWPTFRETVELAELLPAMPDAERWDGLDMETKHVETERMLARLPRLQRQTLVLAAVYGYSPEEIADFQNRPAADVRQAIDAGRRALEQHFRSEYYEDFDEQLEPHTRRSARRGGV